MNQPTTDREQEEKSFENFINAYGDQMTPFGVSRKTLADYRWSPLIERIKLGWDAGASYARQEWQIEKAEMTKAFRFILNKLDEGYYLEEIPEWDKIKTKYNL